jgi:hypothetical protein
MNDRPPGSGASSSLAQNAPLCPWVLGTTTWVKRCRCIGVVHDDLAPLLTAGPSLYRQHDSRLTAIARSQTIVMIVLLITNIETPARAICISIRRSLPAAKNVGNTGFYIGGAGAFFGGHSCHDGTNTRSGAKDSCPICKGAKWVCEVHPATPWAVPGGCGYEREGCQGPGMPRTFCNPCGGIDDPPDMPPGFQRCPDLS